MNTYLIVMLADTFEGWGCSTMVAICPALFEQRPFPVNVAVDDVVDSAMIDGNSGVKVLRLTCYELPRRNSANVRIVLSSMYMP